MGFENSSGVSKRALKMPAESRTRPDNPDALVFPLNTETGLPGLTADVNCNRAARGVAGLATFAGSCWVPSRILSKSMSTMSPIV
jgi:hypothetical protein